MQGWDHPARRGSFRGDGPIGGGRVGLMSQRSVRAGRGAATEHAVGRGAHPGAGGGAGPLPGCSVASVADVSGDFKGQDPHVLAPLLLHVSWT